MHLVSAAQEAEDWCVSPLDSITTQCGLSGSQRAGQKRSRLGHGRVLQGGRSLFATGALSLCPRLEDGSLEPLVRTLTPPLRPHPQDLSTPQSPQNLSVEVRTPPVTLGGHNIQTRAIGGNKNKQWHKGETSAGKFLETDQFLKPRFLRNT